MEFSKSKDKLRHYKSLDTLCSFSKQIIIDKKINKYLNNTSTNSKLKTKQPQSRVATQNHQKIIVNADQFKKTYYGSKNKQKNIDGKKSKIFIPSKNQLFRPNSSKKNNKIKHTSPIINNFTYKKQNTQADSKMKMIKKGKDKIPKAPFKQTNTTKASYSNLRQTQSIFIQPKQYKSKKKSKQQINKHKSPKKLKKFSTEMSLQTTPSCLMKQQIQLLDLIGHGTFGQVFRGKIRKTGEIIAIKRVIQDSRYKNRQIEIIKMLKNDFIVQMLGSYITYQRQQQCLNIKMKFYDQNLFQRIKIYKQSKINKLQIKIILYQLFKGLSYLHSLKICHRDIKPQNILLRGCQTAICDFGSAKILNNMESNISYICARCYRAPQLIFGSTKYSTQVDIWSAGCVILEILNGEPLFIGQTSITHLLQIIKIMGTPTQEDVIQMNSDYNIKEYKFPKFTTKQWQTIFPQADSLLLLLLKNIMVYSPNKRSTAIQILSHQYFDEVRDEFTYNHIKSQFNLKNFFQFSNQQLQGNYHLQDKIIPSWLNQH